MMKRGSRWLLGLIFIAAGLNHFRNPRLYESMMPEYLPWHKSLVAISGYAELFLGVLALLPGWERAARWGLIALMLAVFPANIHMALHPERYPKIPGWLLWVRLPLQFVLIVWAWWATTPDHELVG